MKPYQITLDDGTKIAIITPMQENEIKKKLLEQKRWLVVEINGKQV